MQLTEQGWEDIDGWNWLRILSVGGTEVLVPVTSGFWNLLSENIKIEVYNIIMLRL